MDYRERYKEWVSGSYFDKDTRAELESISDNEKEIKERDVYKRQDLIRVRRFQTARQGRSGMGIKSGMCMICLSV